MKTRFIASVTKTAKKTKTVLPWTRGARRAAFISKRIAEQELRLSA